MGFQSLLRLDGADAIEDEIVRTKVQVMSKSQVASRPYCYSHRGCTQDFIVNELLRSPVGSWYGWDAVTACRGLWTFNLQPRPKLRSRCALGAPYCKSAFLRRCPSFTTLRREAFTYLRQAPDLEKAISLEERYLVLWQPSGEWTEPSRISFGMRSALLERQSG